MVYMIMQGRPCLEEILLQKGIVVRNVNLKNFPLNSNSFMLPVFFNCDTN